MTYEIITPDDKNLYFNLKFKFHLKDTKANRILVHNVRECLDRLREKQLKYFSCDECHIEMTKGEYKKGSGLCSVCADKIQ